MPLRTTTRSIFPISFATGEAIGELSRPKTPVQTTRRAKWATASSPPTGSGTGQRSGSSPKPTAPPPAFSYPKSIDSQSPTARPLGLSLSLIQLPIFGFGNSRQRGAKYGTGRERTMRLLLEKWRVACRDSPMGLNVVPEYRRSAKVNRPFSYLLFQATPHHPHLLARGFVASLLVFVQER